MTDSARQPTPDSVDLIELRVGLAGMASELQQMRSALAPLAGLPLQLDALSRLQDERLTNHIANHARDVDQLAASVEAEAGRRRSADEAMERRLAEDIGGLRDWQTWAMRLVLGLVVAAVVAAVLATP
jgi:hypothetical protein